MEPPANPARFNGRFNALPLKQLTVADFSGLRFPEAMDFSGYVFPRTTNFSDAEFDGIARFVAAVFVGLVEAKDCVFRKEAIFSRAIFCSHTDFDGAQFQGYLSMQNAVCLGGFSALGAKVKGRLLLSRARFDGDGDFSRAQFCDRVSFNGTTFGGTTMFDGARFFQEALFRNTRFSGRTDFNSAAFLERAPDFRGATLHEATEFDDVRWPAPPKSRKEALAQIYAYERLKLEMEKLKKHGDEQEFFRRELRARRELDPVSSPIRQVSAIYDFASGYGSSVKRPTLCFAAIFVLGMLIYANFDMHKGQGLGRLSLWHSVANMLPFLPIRRELFEPGMMAEMTGLYLATSLFQMISGPAFIFLAGLALRNWFRMR